MGAIAPIVVWDKLIIAEILYIGKDAHDYVVIDAFELQELYDGDLLDNLIEAFDEGDLIYDRQTMYQNLSRFLKRNQSAAILARFDADSQRYVVSSATGINGNGNQEIHRDSQEGLAGEGLSLRDKSSVQKNNELLKYSYRYSVAVEQHQKVNRQLTKENKKLTDDVKKSYGKINMAR